MKENTTNVSRRQLMKVLPVAALAGATFKIGETDAEAIGVKPDKRYVFKINSECLEQKDLDCIKDKLVSLGFPDALVISGDVDLYELPR